MRSLSCESLVSDSRTYGADGSADSAGTSCCGVGAASSPAALPWMTSGSDGLVFPVAETIGLTVGVETALVPAAAARMQRTDAPPNAAAPQRIFARRV